MKTFIALEFDNEFKVRLQEIQNKLKKHSLKGRWVNPQNFHLTVKFLGETSEETVKNLDEILNQLHKEYKQYNFSLGNLDFFKGKESLRVVWLGLVGDITELSMMSKDLNEKVNTLGYEIEKRKFRPHITLGRDVILDTELNNFNEELDDLLKYDLKLDKISLMKSEVIENRRVYTSIISYKLKS